jgi:hypothetical protein
LGSEGGRQIVAVCILVRKYYSVDFGTFASLDPFNELWIPIKEQSLRTTAPGEWQISELIVVSNLIEL